MTAKIIFNGKESSSVEEKPPDVRQFYEQMMGAVADKNQNGLPDIVEGMLGANAGHLAASVNLVNFNGQTFSSLDAMPPRRGRPTNSPWPGCGRLATRTRTASRTF